MNDLLVVYFEKEFFLTIDNEAILQRFQNMSMRRNPISSLDLSVQKIVRLEHVFKYFVKFNVIFYIYTYCFFFHTNHIT